MAPNRRRHARQLVAQPVYVAVDGSANGGVLYDVGEGGLAVDIIGTKSTGDPVRLEFDLPETGRHFSAIGRVTWTNEPGNRVGVRFIDLSQASDLQIKEWLWTKSSSAEAAQNPDIPVVEAVPLPGPVPQPQKAAEPIASRWFKPVAGPPPPPAPLFFFPSANILRDLAPLAPSTLEAPAAPTAKPKDDAKSETPVAAKDAAVAKDIPKPVDARPSEVVGTTKGAAAVKDDGSQIINDLRSTLSQSKAAPEPQPREVISSAPTSLELQRRRRTVLLTGLVVVDLLLAVAAVWVYTSEDWRAGLVFDDLKSRMVSAFSAATALPPARPLPAPTPSEPKSVVRHTTSLPKPEITPPEVTPAAVSTLTAEPEHSPGVPAITQYDVMDAQNGHRLLGHTSTGLMVRYERSPEAELQNASATEPQSAAATASEGAPVPLADASGGGHVSQQSSGERPTVQVIPDYPALALQQNIQGKVILRAVIAKDGSLQNVHLVSAPSLLNSAVLNAVKKWRYHPHYQDGQPVEVETEIVVDFSITAK